MIKPIVMLMMTVPVVVWLVVDVVEKRNKIGGTEIVENVREKNI